jgi:Zn-dependent protease with chaperone function
VLLGRGERVLHLGFWTLFDLDKSELKAILAHEYGHFSHGETRLTPVIARIKNTAVQMLMRTARMGGAMLLNPAYWYLRFYVKAFFAATGGHSRRKEILADRAAALAYGGDVFGRALRHTIKRNAAARSRKSGRKKRWSTS